MYDIAVTAKAENSFEFEYSGRHFRVTVDGRKKYADEFDIVPLSECSDEELLHAAIDMEHTLERAREHVFYARYTLSKRQHD
jgi:hypothetical protein